MPTGTIGRRASLLTTVRLLGLVFALSLPACGRSLVVNVVDERSGTPIAHAQIFHGRPEWRLMGILPVQREIMQGHGETDADGRIVFDDVRDGDILTVNGGGAQRTWFTPLWPVTDTRTGTDTTLAGKYQQLNARAPRDRLTLPVPRERVR